MVRCYIDDYPESARANHRNILSGHRLALVTMVLFMLWAWGSKRRALKNLDKRDDP